jgi:hypothetical protein
MSSTTITAVATPSDSRFQVFIEVVQSQVGLDEETIEILHNAINQTYGVHAPVITAPTVSTKKQTPWMCYMREQMALLKGHKQSGSSMLTGIGASWKLLSAEEKLKYGVSSAGSSPATKRKMSGYNLYMKEIMPTLKMEVPVASERLKQVAHNWKALDAEVKKTWNERAKAL